MQTASLDQPRKKSAAPAGFRSVLFAESVSETNEMPEFFRDLNLDQVVDAITTGRDEYNLKPFFYHPLSDHALIEYRQAVMRDVENDALFQCLKVFSERMRSVRVHLTAAKERYYKYEKEAWFLEAVVTYGEAVETLLADLAQHRPQSRGLRKFQEYLAAYTGSTGFREPVERAHRLKTDLAAVRYGLLIRGDRVTVMPYEGWADYSAVVEETFAKFKQGAVTDYRTKFPAYSNLDHIAAQILDRVALLNPDVFCALDEFCASHQEFLDPTIAAFDREIQFYIAWREYAARFRHAGLTFCYPRVSDTSKTVRCRDSFDLALAGKLIGERATVVCNGFALTGSERIAVVTGPNQGGKTTFSRLVGQLHFLASLGLPVPGTDAQLFLCDRILTHFEREEDIKNHRGKLEDDLVRVREMLAAATPNSLLIINEIFSSTTLHDAVLLSRKILERIAALNVLCVCVTFLDELASLNEKTVSFVAGVVPDQPTMRTYKIERRHADGLAYAYALAEKHGLTYDQLRRRLGS